MESKAQQAQHDAPGTASSDLSTLDFMRALSTLVVVSFHYLGMTGRFPSVMNKVTRVAVLMFFVHTSFVLMLSLERQQAKLPEQLWRRFMVRRFFRVYPLTTFVLTAILLFHIPSQMAPPGFHFLELSPGGIAANYALAMNLSYTRSLLSPLWSLPYEFQLYFALPALFLLAKRWRGPAPLFAVSGVAVALALAQPWIPHGGRLDILEFVPCFMAGILCYKISKSAKPLLPFAVWPVLLPAFMSICFLSRDPQSWPPAWIACFLTAVTVPFIRQTRGIVRNVSHWIAQRSYSIYLAHYFCLWLAFRANHFVAIAQWAIFLALLTLLPAMLFRFLELPMIEVGRRLSSTKTAAPVGSKVAAEAL